MDTYIVVGLLLLAALFINYVWNGVVTDTILNLAQAEIDASRCNMLWDQIEREDVDMCRIGAVDDQVFDLPFMDLTVCPSYWWYEIWLWDFYARTLVMTHFASKSTLVDVDPRDFYE